MLRLLKHEDDFVKLFCFYVWLLWRTGRSSRWTWIASDRHVWFRVWGCLADFRRRNWEEEEQDETRSRVFSRLYLRVGCSLLCCSFPVRSVAIFLTFCRWCRICSGIFRKRGGLDWRGDWWTVEAASHCCYQEPGTVGCGAPAWHPRGFSQSRSMPAVVSSRCLMMVIFVFKWGFY